jgi:DNA repair protein RecO (recombination protein O)
VGGYEPALDKCFRCEKPGPHRFFSLAGGGSVCTDCRPSGSATVSADALSLMSALLTSEWTGADSAELKVQREASGVIAAYLQFHLERSLRSLPLVERV